MRTCGDEKRVEQLREIEAEQADTRDGGPRGHDQQYPARQPRPPLAVGIVLAVLLVSTLAHTVLSTMRRRQVDLAVLRALGCTRRQLESTMRWQTFMLIGSALVAGTPLLRRGLRAYAHRRGDGYARRGALRPERRARMGTLARAPSRRDEHAPLQALRQRRMRRLNWL